MKRIILIAFCFCMFYQVSHSLPVIPKPLPVVDINANVTLKTMKLEQIRHFIQELNNWMKQIQILVDQYLTLKGILKQAEAKLGLTKLQLEELAKWGQAIRDIRAIYNRSLDTWHRANSILKGWYNRVKEGIFDPQQDLRDLKDYIFNSMGKTARLRVIAEKIKDPKIIELENEIARQRAIQTDETKKFKKLEDDYEECLKKNKNLPDNQKSDITNVCSQIQNEKQHAENKAKQAEQELKRLRSEYEERMREIAETYDTLQTTSAEWVYTVKHSRLWEERRQRAIACLMLSEIGCQQ
ncbi:MAG: hypothetical protein N2505_00460 [Endomicrobia bacterium]|nr:hypothetical protein [Endomicrobiia bacterium]